jgi:hypothetical protein
MRCGLRLIIVVAMLAPSAGGGPAFAQAGSTGGTVGKTDKSISGGNEQEQPHAPPQEHAAPARPAAPPAAGRWSWQADCMNGHYVGAFRLSQSADGQITGEFLDDSGPVKTGHVTGSITGEKISLTRERGNALPQQWNATLSAPGKMQGTVASLGIQGCTFSASK